MAWRRRAEHREFSYHFNTNIFPYAWLFASYGGFDDHYTVILEPCTAMPISVRDAARKANARSCSRANPYIRVYPFMRTSSLTFGRSIL